VDCEPVSLDWVFSQARSFAVDVGLKVKKRSRRC
jgi:hypothetical protein